MANRFLLWGIGSVGRFLMVVGGAMSHNFALAASPAGVTQAGMIAVVVGLAVCVAVGLTAGET